MLFALLTTVASDDLLPAVLLLFAQPNQDMWTLPTSTESVYYDTTPPVLVKSNNSMWVIGNHMIAALREVRSWQPLPHAKHSPPTSGSYCSIRSQEC